MSSTTSSESYDEMAQFRAILAKLKPEQFPEFVSAIRQKQYCQNEVISAEYEKIHPCKVSEAPLSGSYHLVYILGFEDGIKWDLRIPATGHEKEWDPVAARDHSSEANTMRRIRRETSVPLPEVPSFSSSLDNEIGCPYLLMDFVEGHGAPGIWFDTTVDVNVLEERRRRMLQDVAKAMAQLSKFTYDLYGSPLYDSEGQPAGVGPMAFFADDIDEESAHSGDEDGKPIYREVGPFTDPKALTLDFLERAKPPSHDSSADAYSDGLHKLLKYFVNWMPESSHQPQFVLSHPDFDIQNFIVDTNGGRLSIIDWDGVSSMPRSLGNESLPGWLTRDWDPMMYGYEQGREDGDPCEENSPAELARYRAMYVDFLREHLPKDAEDVTGRSLLAENLKIAATMPSCMYEIVPKVFKECLRASKWPDDPPVKTIDQDISHDTSGAEDDKTESKSDVSGKDTESDADDSDHSSDPEDSDVEYDEDKTRLFEFVTELDSNGQFDPNKLAVVKEGFVALLSKLDNLHDKFWGGEG